MYTFTFVERLSKQDNFDVIKQSGGIYKITCESNGSFYIGQASCFSDRFNSHRRTLEKNEHGNSRLQNCFNKYGITSFSIELIEIVDQISKQNLSEREQYYVDTLNPDLNLHRVVDSPLGYKHTEESVKINTNAQRNRENLISRNTSGYNGVGFYKKTNQWNAKIRVACRNISLGLYDSKEDAYQSRLSAEAKYWTAEFDSLSQEEKIAVLNQDRDNRLKHRNIRNPHPHPFIFKHRDRFEVVVDKKYVGSSKYFDKAVSIRDNYLKLNSSTTEAS